VVELAERDGLISWELFFLVRPGPVVERPEVFVFSVGRLGEDSREGIGEFVADGGFLGSSFFVVGIEDVEVSRAGLAVLGVVCSLAGTVVS